MQRIDLDAIAAQKPVNDRLLVDGMGRGLAHVRVGHHLDVVQEDHPDVRNRRGSAGQRGLQAVVFLIRDFQRDVAVARFHFGHAGGGVGHELDRHGLELGRAAPVVFVRLQADIGVALELLDHIGAGTDGCRLEAFGTDAFVIGLGQDVAGQEIHPLEDRRVELGDIGDDLVALDAVVGQRAPDELDRAAGFGVGDAGQRPSHVFRRQRAAVMPGHAVTDGHPDLGLVVVPAPFGQDAGGGFQVGLLQDVLVEDRLIDALDRRVHSAWADGRIPGGQVDVIGDDQLFDGLGASGKSESAKRKRGSRKLQE